MKEMQPQVKKDNPGVQFVDMGRILGKRWRALEPHEKKRYEDMAAEDKVRFQVEMQQYTASQAVASPSQVPESRPLREEPNEHVDDDHRISRPAKRQRKCSKDPAAPKGARAAYTFFMKEMQPQVKKEFAGVDRIEIQRILGKRWRALEPHERKRYEDMAAEDKVRFQVEMQQYTASQAVASPSQVPESRSLREEPNEHVDDDHHPSRPVKRQRKCSKDPAAPNGARAAYTFFMKETQPQVKKEFAGVDRNEIQRILGERWRALEPHEKKRYEDMAAEDKVRFHVEMQQVHCQPSRREFFPSLGIHCCCCSRRGADD